MSDRYYMTVDSRSLEKNMLDLEIFLSGMGLSAFLGSVMGPYLSKRAKARFASEGDDVTGPWTPLKPATVSFREEQNYGAGPINRRTGELENWVVGSGWNAYPLGLGASMDYPKNKPTGELKDKVETAQKGRAFPKTVARPVLGLNENDMIFFQTALQLAVTEALR